LRGGGYRTAKRRQGGCRPEPSERKDSPEIDRARSRRPDPSQGKAETQAATWRVAWETSGVRTAGMQLNDSTGTRESRPVQAMTCKVRQANKARETCRPGSSQ